VDEEWRNYRGGQIRPVWVVDTGDWSLEKLPWDESSANVDPVWMEETIYFLSDRDYAMNLYGYDTSTGELSQLTRHSRFDVKNIDAGGGVVVYEQGGYLHLYDPAEGTSRQVEIRVDGDFPWARPHWEDVGERIAHAGISPSGVRAVFEARGEIFTVPAEEGDWRALTRSPGTADRTPAWSPDGERVAWFSDASGEYRLLVGDQKGLEEPREIRLPDPTYFYDLQWSPDGEHLLYTDADRVLRYLDVETGEVTRVDQDNYTPPGRTMDPVWSPDSRWIAYAKRLESQFRQIWVYSLERDEAFPVTNPRADAISPAWDAGGEYLYFAASTDYGLNTGWLDMSSYDRPVTRGLYMAILEEGTPSPLLPESDEEPGDGGDGEGNARAPGAAAGNGDGAEDGEDPTVTIDREGLQDRIVSLGIDDANYGELETAGAGVLFFRQFEPNQGTATGPAPASLKRYTLESREAEEFLPGVQGYAVSHDGKKLLYRAGGTWGIVPTEGKPEPGQGALETDELRTRVDPRAEWRQIFEEAWRLQRDYLYVENLHGADWDRIRDWYGPWVDHVRHRSDLTYLLNILGGEVSVGHSFVGGGDEPDVEEVPVGLLGADLEVAGDRYRISRILDGESWNPDVRAPLAEPGVDVSEGDYLLAVNGRPLDASMNPYRLLDGTAGRQISLTVNDRPSTEGARTVTVVPVESEGELRRRAWVEENRRRVDRLSDGRLGYVYLPNTARAGYEYFNRYFFSQQGKEGVIIDERYNGGGSAADYMVDIMARELHGFFNNPVRPEKPFTLPGSGIWGPKVMITNEYAGSGGDLLPYLFRKMEIGPLVGTTTWGGLVGIWDTPPFIDGGIMTAPRGGFYDLQGEWAVENEGVAPDIRVEQRPAATIPGGDPQLERAVEEALRLLETGDWPEIRPQPEDPVRTRRPGGGG
jgi:tricorn protease